MTDETFNTKLFGPKCTGLLSEYRRTEQFLAEYISVIEPFEDQNAVEKVTAQSANEVTVEQKESARIR